MSLSKSVLPMMGPRVLNALKVIQEGVRAKENEVAEMRKLSRMAEDLNEKRKNKENLSKF